jgi:hypothetical protein
VFFGVEIKLESSVLILNSVISPLVIGFSTVNVKAEELGELYSLPNIVRVVKSRRMRWARHVARMGEGRGVHRFLVGKHEGKRPLGRPRRRWEDNIKMDLQEIGGIVGFFQPAHIWATNIE